MKSIMQEEPRCFVCGKTQGLELHHVMSGTANRTLSTEYGLVVMLCADHHRGKNGVHSDYALKNHLEQSAQLAFEQVYGHTKWMEVFRKNYL